MVCKIKKNEIEFELLEQGGTFICGGSIYMKTSTVQDGHCYFNCVNLSTGVIGSWLEGQKVQLINMECREV